MQKNTWYNSWTEKEKENHKENNILKNSGAQWNRYNKEPPEKPRRDRSKIPLCREIFPENRGRRRKKRRTKTKNLRGRSWERSKGKRSPIRDKRKIKWWKDSFQTDSE